MKLTRQDRQVINNFATFNQNLEFKKDLKTDDTWNGYVCEYTLESDEFKSFIIYDTPEFLKLYNCFINPKVSILDDKIIFNEHNTEFQYHTSEREICRLPTKTIAEFIDNKIPDTQFELTFDDIKSIKRIRERIHLSSLIIKPNEDNYHCLVMKDDFESAEFTLTTYHKTNRDYKVRCRVPKESILISNYKVSIFEKFMLLESKDIPLKYLIALEPKPAPDSKETREILNYYAKD